MGTGNGPHLLDTVAAGRASPAAVTGANAGADADAQLKAGSLLIVAGRAEDAKAGADKALAINPKNVDALVLRANARPCEPAARPRPCRVLSPVGPGRRCRALPEERGDGATAEELLRRAIDADAANLDAYSMLAGLYLSGGRFDEAVAEFDNLAARQPKAVGPPTLAALVLQAAGKNDEARQRFERLVEANPHAAVAANNLAWMYASKGEQLDRALQLAQSAKAEIPDHPEVNDTLGFVYLKKQLPSLAIAPLRLAVEKDPKNPSFHYRLGLAYAQTGDKVAARRSLEQALKLKPDFEGAEDARKVLSTLG